MTTPTRTTAIAWTDHTINFWCGCTKVSPACTHCYAEKLGAYFGKRLFGQPVKWGQGQPRFERLLQARQEALKLNHRASRCRILNGIPMIECGSTETVGCPESLRIDFTDARVPLKKRKLDAYQQLTPLEWETLPSHRPRVFVNSMSDWLDDEVPVAWLAYLLETIHLCPHLDFQLLTKRPENWQIQVMVAGMHMMGYRDGQTGTEPQEKPSASEDCIEAVLGWSKGETQFPNIWLGTTTENQEYADKRISHLLKISAKIRFLSCEPLSGPINLGDYRHSSQGEFNFNGIHWVIAGGESGASARPSHPDWFRSLRDQCASAGVPFFFKQWGEWIPVDQLRHVEGGSLLKSYKGQKLPDGTLMLRTGTKLSSNLLDGHKHEAFPAPQS